MEKWNESFNEEVENLKNERQNYDITNDSATGIKIFSHLSSFFTLLGFVALVAMFFTEITFIQATCLFVIGYALSVSFEETNQSLYKGMAEDIAHIRLYIKTNIKQDKMSMENNKENILKAKEYKEEIKEKPYIFKKYGLIEQEKDISTENLYWNFVELPIKDINDYVKKAYLMMFCEMMEENNLSFEDFKLEYNYVGYGPHKRFYIEFTLANQNYAGWDEWISKANLTVKMRNGEKKSFEVKNLHNDLTEYFDRENEYTSVHFFDALDRCYRYFEYADGTSYISDYGTYEEGKKYSIVVDDIIDHYNQVGKKMNVVFADEKFGILDYWCGEDDYDKLFKKTNIIDKSWMIDKKQKLLINSGIDKNDKIKKLEQSQNDDDKCKLAIMYLYKYSWKDKENFQSKAIEILKELNERNHSFAQLVLGIIYYDGEYVLKNTDKAKLYIEKAFENGLEKPAKEVWNELELWK